MNEVLMPLFLEIEHRRVIWCVRLLPDWVCSCWAFCTIAAAMWLCLSSHMFSMYGRKPSFCSFTANHLAGSVRAASRYTPSGGCRDLVVLRSTSMNAKPSPLPSVSAAIFITSTWYVSAFSDHSPADSLKVWRGADDLRNSPETVPVMIGPPSALFTMIQKVLCLFVREGGSLSHAFTSSNVRRSTVQGACAAGVPMAELHGTSNISGFGSIAVVIQCWVDRADIARPRDALCWILKIQKYKIRCQKTVSRLVISPDSVEFPASITPRCQPLECVLNAVPMHSCIASAVWVWNTAANHARLCIGKRTRYHVRHLRQSKQNHRRVRVLGVSRIGAVANAKMMSDRCAGSVWRATVLF